MDRSGIIYRLLVFRIRGNLWPPQKLLYISMHTGGRLIQRDASSSINLPVARGLFRGIWCDPVWNSVSWRARFGQGRGRVYILYIKIYLLFWKKYGRRIGKGIEIFVKYFSYFSNYENFKQFDHLGYNLARINRKWLADG